MSQNRTDILEQYMENLCVVVAEGERIPCEIYKVVVRGFPVWDEKGAMDVVDEFVEIIARSGHPIDCSGIHGVMVIQSRPETQCVPAHHPWYAELAWPALFGLPYIYTLRAGQRGGFQLQEPPPG